MIHFFPKFARDVQDTPFALELHRQGAAYRVFAEHIDREYKTRAGLLLRVYPILIWFAVRSAVRSLLLSRPAPDTAVVTSDVEAIIFGVLARLFGRRTRIVFETFIATPRRSPLSGAAHLAYYRFVLSFVDAAICHSKVEAARYADLFAGARARFVYLPYGLSVSGRADLRAAYANQSAASNVIVAAGRSGRDYKTLAEAITGLPCKLRIICDWERPTQDIEESDQVTILRNCFGADYLVELAKARFVVVPLSVHDISAGQMVLLQAFALGKAVIVTDTLTTPDYAVDGRDAVFVDRANTDDMRQKIHALLSDDALCQRIGAFASERFDRDFSTESYVGKLVTATRELNLDAEAAQPAAARNAGRWWAWLRLSRLPAR